VVRKTVLIALRMRVSKNKMSGYPIKLISLFNLIILVGAFVFHPANADRLYCERLTDNPFGQYTREDFEKTYPGALIFDDREFRPRTGYKDAFITKDYNWVLWPDSTMEAKFGRGNGQPVKYQCDKSSVQLAEERAKERQEAKKAAEVEAKKNAELAEALGEALDLYGDFVSFVKSGKDTDVVKSAELFQTKPDTNKKWTLIELEQYRRFKKAALDNPDFFAFHQNQAEARLTAISNERARLQMALESMHTKLYSIMKARSLGYDQASSLYHKLYNIVKPLHKSLQPSLKAMSDAENEMATFFSKIEKLQQTKQLVLKEQEKAIGILEAKLTVGG
jgi:hypothetical protein